MVDGTLPGSSFILNFVCVCVLIGGRSCCFSVLFSKVSRTHAISLQLSRELDVEWKGNWEGRTQGVELIIYKGPSFRLT